MFCIEQVQPVQHLLVSFLPLIIDGRCFTSLITSTMWLVVTMLRQLKGNWEIRGRLSLNMAVCMCYRGWPLLMYTFLLLCLFSVHCFFTPFVGSQEANFWYATLFDLNGWKMYKYKNNYNKYSYLVLT